ncbi:MAG TPA: adenosine kinase [Bacteroidales bacterium]|nr:adenosine kinase [Bacteroidales bacterium]
MKQILGIGNALVDVMTRIDSDNVLQDFSLPKGSMQLVDHEKSAQVKLGTDKFQKSLASGGSAANTIHGLGMLGLPAGFIGSIGNDKTGDFFENDMKSAGISTFLIRRESVTGTAVALISPDSERTFATHLGAATELIAEDLKSDFFSGYDILYLEGYLIFNRPLIEEACKIARSKKIKVALDLASYNVVEAKLQDFKDIVENYTDIIFANEEEARAFTGKEPEEALGILSEMCDIAVVKTGSEGSMIKRGEEIIKIGTIKVTPKDTTGAGDLYASGFLYGLAMDYSLEICGLLGSVLAGNVIEAIGAKMNSVTWVRIKNTIDKILMDNK